MTRTVLAGVAEVGARAGAAEGGPVVLAGAARQAGVGRALRRARARRQHAVQHGARALRALRALRLALRRAFRVRDALVAGLGAFGLVLGQARVRILR